MKKWLKRLKAKAGYMLVEVLLAVLILALTVTGIFATLTMMLQSVKQSSELNETREYASQVIDSIVAINELGGRNMVTIISDLYGSSKLPHTIEWDELMYETMYKEKENENENEDDIFDDVVEDIENPNDVVDILSWTEMIPEEVRVKYKTEIRYIPYNRVTITDTFADSDSLIVRQRDKCVTLEIKVTKIVDDWNNPFLKLLGERVEGSTTYYLTLYASGNVEAFDMTGVEYEWVAD